MMSRATAVVFLVALLCSCGREVEGAGECSRDAYCMDGAYCVSLDGGGPFCAYSCGPYKCLDDEECVSLTPGHDACIPRGEWSCGERTCNGVFCVYLCKGVGNE
jgi:hypothetical protein